MVIDQRLKNALGFLAAAFRVKDLGPENFEVYAQRLAVIDLDLLEAAVIHLADTARFFPSIAEIREAAKQLDAGKGHPSALAAWGMARMKQHRGTSSEALIDKAVMEAVGWHQIENATATDMSFHRKAFCERYTELVTEAEGPAPDVRRMVEQYQERIQKLLPKTAEVRRAMESLKPTETDPEPAKPLGSLMKAYEAELARIAAEKAKANA